MTWPWSLPQFWLLKPEKYLGIGAPGAVDKCKPFFNNSLNIGIFLEHHVCSLKDKVNFILDEMGQTP